MGEAVQDSIGTTSPGSEETKPAVPSGSGGGDGVGGDGTSLDAGVSSDTGKDKIGEDGKIGEGGEGGQEEEIAVSPEALDDYFTFTRTKREREQAASQLAGQQAGQSGEQTGEAPAAVAPPPAAAQQEEYQFEPFKIADEHRDSCLDTPENLEGLLHSSGSHYMEAAVNEMVSMHLEAAQMIKASETRSIAGLKEELLSASRFEGRMDRFFELPENEDVADYPDKLRAAAYREAAAKHPKASQKEQFKHTAQILRDGVRTVKLLERNLREGHDVRPNRKAPSDSPKTGGDASTQKPQPKTEGWGQHLRLRSEQ